MSLRFSFGGFFAAVVLIFACSGLVRADVIYTNFGTDSSWSAGTGLIVTHDDVAWSSVAIGFIPSSNFNLSSIEVVASELGSNDAGSLIGIFADDSGHPGGPALESFRLDGMLGQFGGPAPVLAFTSLLQPLLLADTPYWVGMQGPASGFIVWNQNSSFASGFMVADGSGNWSSSDAAQGVIQIDGVAASPDEIPPPPLDPNVIDPTLDPILNPIQPAASTLNLNESLIQPQQNGIQPQQNGPLTALPEPGAAWLMLIGLVAIALTAKQKIPRLTHKK